VTEPPEVEHPLVGMTDADLSGLLSRAFWETVAIGGVCSLIVLIASGWRDGAMLAVGAGISAASILEWQRLIKLINAKMDNQKMPRSAGVVVVLFLMRLGIFGAAIYVSLKCFQGSVVALLSGLALAVAVTAFEALRLLKD
jgi:hypothetical protein